MSIKLNIKEAKQEVINTVRAYLKKDETGAYEIPPERQRPILLMGPPGIGKTAIMEQVAEELGISLISYTITHHTRQSAIGLPFISRKEYGGEEHAVTEYTMSEIVASVYDRIEASGIAEGILFLDEINCVSETLAPTMLQFLQYKMFGNHKVPEGFIIVTAGNPPQYNKSVRDFDIVTLDRVKRIDIEEDFTVWKEYAYQAGIHGAILSYLEIRKKDFYSVKTQIDGRQFVTARGWEDLSRILKVYEKMGIEAGERLCVQYLQDPEIASNFASYYELYGKYRTLYRIPEILEGAVPEESGALREAPFDEKLSILGLLIDSLNQEFTAYAENKEIQVRVLRELAGIRRDLKNAGAVSADGGEQSARALVSATENRAPARWCPQGALPARRRSQDGRKRECSPGKRRRSPERSPCGSERWRECCFFRVRRTRGTTLCFLRLPLTLLRLTGKCRSRPLTDTSPTVSASFPPPLARDRRSSCFCRNLQPAITACSLSMSAATTHFTATTGCSS